jgi:hypothetical protein
MWWLPEADSGANVARAVRQLSAALRDERSTPISDIYGVGAALDGANPYPLILVRQSLVEGLIGRGPRRFFPFTGPINLLSTFAAWTSLLIPWPELRQSRLVPDSFARLELPETAVAVAVDAPEDMGSSSTAFAGCAVVVAPPGLTGTAALGARRAGRLGFLTAGHVVAPHPGGKAQISGREPLGGSATGFVDVFCDPHELAGQPGYDIGLVYLDQGCSLASLPVIGWVRPGTSFSSPVVVELYGGLTGRRFGLVVGSLVDVGDDARRWAHCWIVVPILDNSLTNGDSGAPVITSLGRELLGIFVGGSRVGELPFSIEYVQDASSIWSSWLIPKGISPDMP